MKFRSHLDQYGLSNLEILMLHDIEAGVLALGALTIILLFLLPAGAKADRSARLAAVGSALGLIVCSRHDLVAPGLVDQVMVFVAGMVMFVLGIDGLRQRSRSAEAR